MGGIEGDDTNENGWCCMMGQEGEGWKEKILGQMMIEKEKRDDEERSRG